MRLNYNPFMDAHFIAYEDLAVPLTSSDTHTTIHFCSGGALEIYPITVRYTCEQLGYNSGDSISETIRKNHGTEQSIVAQAVVEFLDSLDNIGRLTRQDRR